VSLQAQVKEDHGQGKLCLWLCLETYSTDQAGAETQAWAKRVCWAQVTEMMRVPPGEAGQAQEGLWMLSGS